MGFFNTYFIIEHFHYILSSDAVIAIFSSSSRPFAQNFRVRTLICRGGAGRGVRDSRISRISRISRVRGVRGACAARN